MTFYSIIFGVLFICACKELFQTLLQKEWEGFCQASSLALLIFNDALYTSHEIEQLKIEYTIQMKFIDLVDFLLLALAIVVLDPINNQLGVKAKMLYKKNEEFFFWCLLAGYWILTLLWNYLAGPDWIGSTGAQPPPFLIRSYREVQYPLLLPLIAMCILAAKWPSSRVTQYVRRLVPTLLVLYIGIFKLYVYAAYAQHSLKGTK